MAQMMTGETPSTVMGAAFRAAGYESLGERLEHLMSTAILANGGIADPSIDAFVKALLVEDDAALVWELVVDVRMLAIRRLFSVVLPQMRHAIGASSSSRARTHDANPTAPPPPVRVSPALPVSRPASSVSTPQSHLDRFIVNGRPIGDLCPAEAATAEEHRSREATFIDLLISRLPQGGSNCIRDHISADEADQLWRLAATAESEEARLRTAAIVRATAAKMRAKLDEKIELLSMLMPTGKLLRDSTREELIAYDGWMIRVVERMKPNQTVWEAGLSEMQLRELYENG